MRAGPAITEGNNQDQGRQSQGDRRHKDFKIRHKTRHKLQRRLKERDERGAAVNKCGMEPGEESPTSDIVPDTSLTNISCTTQPSSSPTDSTMDLTCRPRAKSKATTPPGDSWTASGGGVTAHGGVCRDLGGDLTEVALKPEIQTDDATQDGLHPSQLSPPDDPSPDRLNSLGLDLAWMQERVSHLGAAYAVAQLGLGNTENGHPSASFPSQGGDSLDGPPAMLFPGGTHEMAAFAASFDLASASAATVEAAPWYEGTAESYSRPREMRVDEMRREEREEATDI
ncbi:hypothetical protein EYF80_026991 [Liparis tanakae]|uniref:Uncharacterized protein n=1 Tax=Liparis tanakae TaxID=230148 RepID=A0A4Z2HBW6_9TELE|nr:hypothetical protein EYF80_026991 [Liparis tanakae]